MLTDITIANPSEGNQDDWFLLSDYTLVSKWDNNLNSWLPSTKQVYQYNNDFKLVRIVTLDRNSNDTLSRVSYEYNEKGSMTAEYFEDWVSNRWIGETRYVMDYDEYQRRTSMTTFIMLNNEWIQSARQSGYIYNEMNLLVANDSERWTGNSWLKTFTDFFYYDDDGHLILRIRKDTTGEFSYRIYYYYNDKFQRTQLFVQYYQKTTGLWVNSYRDLYYFNACGRRTSTIRERFVNDSWINEKRTDIFYTVEFSGSDKHPRVPICHNGNTIYVIKKVLQHHLDHGDCVGSCPETKESHSDIKMTAARKPSETPFTIYPNPASDRITVVRNENGAGIYKVDIVDMNGNILKSETISDSGEVCIERGRLTSGQYIVRIHGEQIYNLVVVFN